MPRIATQPQLAPIGSHLSATKRPTDRNASNNATHAGAANSDRFERVTSSSRAGNLDNIGGRFNTIAAGAGSRLDSLTAGLAAPTPGAGASMNVSRGADRHNNLPTTDRAPGRDATASHSIRVDGHVSSDPGLNFLWDDFCASRELNLVSGGSHDNASPEEEAAHKVIEWGISLVSAAVTPAVIALDYACDKTWKPRVTLSENSSTSETEAAENEAPEADSKETTPMPESDGSQEANTLSAEELKALKERLYLAAKESMTRPTGETHNGAPEVGTHNPMERQELNHLILNTDEKATSDDFDLPFVNEVPARVDPIEATTQPPASNGTDENDS